MVIAHCIILLIFHPPLLTLDLWKLRLVLVFGCKRCLVDHCWTKLSCNCSYMQCMTVSIVAAFVHMEFKALVVVGYMANVA